MSEEQKSATVRAVDGYIGLNDFAVHFEDDVAAYFTKHLGEKEFSSICKLSCQAPPYTSIRINLLSISREDALELVKSLLAPFNDMLKKEGRDPVVPYLHKTISELIIIPPAKSICPSVDDLKSMPLVLIDRMCAESVLRGSDIFVKGVRAVDKACTKGQKVCVAVDLCNNDLPRGSDVSLFTGSNLIIGEAVLQMTRTEIMSSESGLCLDQIHRLSCHRYLSPSLPVDLPPLQQLPDCLLMQNFPSLLTSRVLNPAPKSCVLDCCAAPGNKWSHLCMLMQDQGLIVGVWARREAQVGMDRSRKKAIDNLFAIKKKFGYVSLQVRYLDMTKAGVMEAAEEERLRAEGAAYRLQECGEAAGDPTQSKSFMKKMARIQRQKERKQREHQQKRAAEGETPVAVKRVSVEEQAALTLERYKHSKKTLLKEEKNTQELCLLSPVAEGVAPAPLVNLLNAGVHAKTAKIPGYPREVFDFVLLDPPCSALGLRPRLSHQVSMEELYGYRNYQRQFIDVAVQLLRAGGVLVYSTCTYDPLENEENVAFILRNYPMELMTQDEALRFGKEGLKDCGLTDEERSKVQRFNMTEECNSIGFFISCFRKTHCPCGTNTTPPTQLTWHGQCS
ncbi:hypothetical protein BLSTO_04267 [Blastocystis sp. subtype 1]